MLTRTVRKDFPVGGGEGIFALAQYRLQNGQKALQCEEPSGAPPILGPSTR